MTYKTFFMFASLSLFSTSTSLYSLEASFTEEELCEINHTNIKRIIEKQLQDNPGLLVSSQNKDIVAFIGKTGSGKSTLINFLNDKQLTVSDTGAVILSDSSDSTTMKIGTGFESETMLPQFINCQNLLFYDLPGIGDTRGTAISLVNACFIKSIIENAKTASLIFVVGEDEITAQRGTLFKELSDIIRTLIPNEPIIDFSSLVITKSQAGFNNEKLINRLKEKIEHNILNPWLQENRLTHMSSPLGNEINHNDRSEILQMIIKTPSKKLNNINIGVIYNGEEKNKLREIYQAEIKDISNNLYNSNFNLQNLAELDKSSLQNKKIYFQDSLLNNIITILDQSPLMTLLKPISNDIYDMVWNEIKEILLLKISEATKTIDVQIKEHDRQLEENARKAEEQRRIQAEIEQSRLQNEVEQQRQALAAQCAQTKAEEQRRLQAEAEQSRLQNDIEQQRQALAAQCAQTKAEEQRRLQAEAAQNHLQNDIEQQRQALAAQQAQTKAEEQRRLQAEAAQNHLQNENEQQRQALQNQAEQVRQFEEQRRLQAEAEKNQLLNEIKQQREILQAQVEQARQVEEGRRIQAEAVQNRLQSENAIEQQKSLAAQNSQIQAEQARQVEEQRRIQAEAEINRLKNEINQKNQDLQEAQSNPFGNLIFQPKNPPASKPIIFDFFKN